MMASGLPVIASDQGGTGELVRDGVDGLVFRGGDPDALAHGICRLAAMSPEDRASLGIAARSRIKRVCDPDEVVARRVRHFESISRRTDGADARSRVWAPGGATRIELEMLSGTVGAACSPLPSLDKAIATPENPEEAAELVPYLLASRTIARGERGVPLIRTRNLLRRLTPRSGRRG
jgi:hypothetical protein